MRTDLVSAGVAFIGLGALIVVYRNSLTKAAVRTQGRRPLDERQQRFLTWVTVMGAMVSMMGVGFVAAGLE